MNYLFGPVPSRRLGRSLGIDVIPPKTCSLDCVYCESGRTTHLSVRKRDFVPPRVVMKQLADFFRDHPEGADVLTFSSAGEPALYESLGELIGLIKAEYPQYPLVVLTNGTLLWDSQVRRALLQADRVVPSLDAGTPGTFVKVNRPHPELAFDLYLEGILAFRKEYRGEFHLEVLLVEGMNDGEDELAAIRALVDRIRPDRLELNTVVRPPALAGIRGLSREAMERASRAFPPEITSIIGEFKSPAKPEFSGALDQRVTDMVLRRPCTAGDMADSLGVDPVRLQGVLNMLIQKGVLDRYKYSGLEYYRIAAVEKGPASVAAPCPGCSGGPERSH